MLKVYKKTFVVLWQYFAWNASNMPIKKIIKLAVKLGVGFIDTYIIINENCEINKYFLILTKKEKEKEKRIELRSL